MALIWPVYDDFPQVPLYEGFAESPPDLTLRTGMDAGPDKTRPIATDGPRAMSAVFPLTESQVETLDEFYYRDTLCGEESFQWVHPRTDATITCRFLGPPAYAPQGGNLWHGLVKLKELP